MVRFEVTAAGEVQNVAVLEPSEFIILNSAALDLLKKMPRLEPRLSTETYTLPIIYRLQ
jgi:TonB family protein